MQWPIDKWKKLSSEKQAYTIEPSCTEWNMRRRAYRKKLVADGTVKVDVLDKGLVYVVKVKGRCVGSWTSARRGREVMYSVFNTVQAMEGVIL